MTLLATDSPESATHRLDTGMRPWPGRLMAIAGVILLGLLMTLVSQIGMQSEAHRTPAETIIMVLVTLASLLVLMAYIVIRRAALLWRQAKDGLIGTRLQSRIIIMFCSIAILPTVIVSVFSAVFFNFGVQSWFDARVSTALTDSVKVATAYLDEHRNSLRSDAISMAGDIQQRLSLVYSSPQIFSRSLTERTAIHRLSEAVIFDRQRVLARSALSFSLMFERLPEDMLDRADEGNVVFFGEDEDKISALVKVSSTPEMYLMVGRVVDPAVVEHMQAARGTVKQYRQLQHDIKLIQGQFFTVFILMALLVLLASLWAGMMLAVRLIGPITELMAATERVRAGDYSIKVVEGPEDDEIANLARTFNRMTGQLENQRRDLLEANRQLDERRRFTEAVLSGVSAGVVALNSNHEITLHNRTAVELLGFEPSIQLSGRILAELLPEIDALLHQAERQPERIASTDTVIQRGERRITLHVQVTAERFGEAIEGFIVTFDDITALVSAQRSAAWADVARRIAHEIKNPLTPITLSAERLRKKFGNEISSDREGYDRYLDTIGRHVKDIGRMVEEFVAFARMPAAIFRDEDVCALVSRIIFSEQTVHPEIAYISHLPQCPVTLYCDESQLGQSLLNLLKNAAEALENKTSGKKEITVTLTQNERAVVIEICDNGPGFPPDRITQLMEPYVTTRSKGTGLGLAIVKRTIEEHKGSIELSNLPQGGACVTITFARKNAA